MNDTVTTEIDDLKTRLKATWMAGNYDYFSRFMESSATQLLDRLPLGAGGRLLDVACGSGQLGLLAARNGATVTGVDIATNSIAAARGRAASEGLNARFDEGDAEDLPYRDESFDVVVSLYGAMFAPRPDRVASELVRVCRVGGTIGMANWTKEGFVGTMFQAIGRFIGPPGMPSPLLWGDEATVTKRFGDTVSQLQLRRVPYVFDYPFSPAGVVDFFAAYYGPANRAFASLTEEKRAALRSDLIELWSGANRSGDANRTVVSAEYLEILAVRG